MQKNLEGKTLNDYEDVISEFCDDNKELTIYLAGELSHPGISDLDFLVVNKKPVVSERVNLFLSGGNVIIMPDFFMEKVKDFENLNLKLIQGEEHKIKEPNEYFKYIEIIEWLPERILKIQKLKEKNYSDQDLMLLHKSVNRSIRAVSTLTNINIDLIDEDEFRSGRITNNKHVLEETFRCSEVAWDHFESFIIDNKVITGTVRGSVNISPYYNFSDKFNILLLYFKRMISLKHVALSEELKLRTELSGHCYLDKKFENYAISRWNDINRLFLWFQKNNLKKGMIKYGWFL